jgi:hypothetical protein
LWGILGDLVVEGESQDELGVIGHRDPTVVTDGNVEFSGRVFGAIDGVKGNLGGERQGSETILLGFGGGDGDQLGVVNFLSRVDGPTITREEIGVLNKVEIGCVFDFPNSREGHFVDIRGVVELPESPLRACLIGSDVNVEISRRDVVIRLRVDEAHAEE